MKLSSRTLENEGAYSNLAAGQAVVWLMRWYLRAVPKDMTASVGSSELVDFVRSELGK